MSHWFSRIFRVVATLIVVAVASLVGYQLWVYYMDAPWTRDGQVTADVVGLTPDVSGLVVEVLATDNQQVKAGDLLFRIDPSRYEIALRQAEAVLASKKAALVLAERNQQRYSQLTDLTVTAEEKQTVDTDAAMATAAVEQATADRDLAALNLERTRVKAPVDGIVTNFTMRKGDYVTTGHAVFALIDSDSFYVDGYFPETKLSRIAVGDRAVVVLLGDDPVVTGRVQSIAGGISSSNVAASSSLLARIDPTFDWVRLAQRVPVRIELDEPLPAGVKLVVGRTASVEILPQTTGTGAKPAP